MKKKNYYYHEISLKKVQRLKQESIHMLELTEKDVMLKKVYKDVYFHGIIQQCNSIIEMYDSSFILLSDNEFEEVEKIFS